MHVCVCHIHLCVQECVCTCVYVTGIYMFLRVSKNTCDGLVQYSRSQYVRQRTRPSPTLQGSGLVYTGNLQRPSCVSQGCEGSSLMDIARRL